MGDLISDETALTLTMDKDELKLKPELLRAEAVTALMQLTASQAVRGDLRKTHNQQELSQLQPGQTVAFWRSRQRKKGSWSLGRFWAFDPDKKSCWIQVGKTSELATTKFVWPLDGRTGHPLKKMFGCSKMLHKASGMTAVEKALEMKRWLGQTRNSPISAPSRSQDFMNYNR